MKSLCYFCGRKISSLVEFYLVREAVKPPHAPHRWRTIGKCCVICHDEGCTTNIDPYQEKKT